MPSRRVILALASLSLLSPAAFANHPVAHQPPGPLEPALALAEMASDGYVVLVTRPSERVFEIRVLHQQVLTRVAGSDVGLQYAFEPVNVEGASRSCPTNAACGNQGLWLHGLRADVTGGGLTQAPTDGFFPSQVHAIRTDAAGTYLEVTITANFSPTYQGVANAVVGIDNDGPGGWVRGLFNAAKLTAPVDALDAFGEIVRIS